ncbi:Uncharacterised protein [Niallia circulans]|jgi:hypothetical protein|uniref:hypothetical protein n=1 Tax=Shouchella clausii TaxID=79880 RepID=UPI000BA55C5C|nr:hypothetical protein [Shouchella clausii]MCM3549727.1 hypothetical protein [Shouchella clausii]PAF14709.1 hypothetical protein CHH59_08095 [Shouchella clausii]SPU21624.1 Uncharacterised protein [Niallia circulans]
MDLPALSQWEAFMVETLLAKGMERQTLINLLKAKDAETLNNFDDTFDYHELITAAETALDNLTQAVQVGYTIKFVSKFGIKRLLGLKYGLEEGIDYQMADDRFDNLTLTAPQLAEFKAMLSPNWKVFNEINGNGTFTVSILHATLVNKT